MSADWRSGPTVMPALRLSRTPGRRTPTPRPSALARLTDDAGSTLPLIGGAGLLALALILVVAASTSLYVERKRLFTLADSAALVGAESFELDDVVVAGDGPTAALTPEQVERAVRGYLADVPADRFDALRILRATTHDGRSATVSLSSEWHPPVIAVVLPDGVRLEVTAVARSVFG